MTVSMEQREIERADGVDLVSAPRDWTGARIEAWLDWGDALPADHPAIELPQALQPGSDIDPALGGGPDRYARRTAAWGLALKMFDAEGAVAFREALLASLLSGEAAPARTLPSGVRAHPFAPAEAAAPAETIVGLGDIEFDRAIDAHLATVRAAEAATAGAQAVSRALQAVTSAVSRCEGDASACADPLRNPALGRAARAAREAGASDGLIRRAIGLASAGEGLWSDANAAPIPAPAPLVLSAAREVAEAMSPEANRAALAAWDTGSVILAFDRRDAEAAQRALDAPRAAIDVRAFADAPERLAATAHLWTLALEIETAAGFCADPAVAARRQAWRPLGLTLAGLSEHLAAQGLSYASDAGRQSAQVLFAVATAGALEASIDLAKALGPYPEYAGEIQARLRGLKAKPFAHLLKAAKAHGLRHAEVTALFADAELSLRLGGASLAGEAWCGPLTVAETDDGILLPHLSTEARAGLGR